MNTFKTLAPRQKQEHHHQQEHVCVLEFKCGCRLACSNKAMSVFEVGRSSYQVNEVRCAEQGSCYVSIQGGGGCDKTITMEQRRLSKVR